MKFEKRTIFKKNEIIQLTQVIIPFEFKCMNVRNILAALYEV